MERIIMVILKLSEEQKRKNCCVQHDGTVKLYLECS